MIWFQIKDCPIYSYCTIYSIYITKGRKGPVSANMLIHSAYHKLGTRVPFWVHQHVPKAACMYSFFNVGLKKQKVTERESEQV